MTVRTIVTTALALTSAAILAACESEDGTSARATTPAAASSAVPADAVSPANERERRRQAAWQNAISGLRVEDDRLVVVDPPARGDAASADRLVREGDAALASNERTDAVKAYASAVRAAPGLTEPYLKLAFAFITKGEIDLAVATYRTAIDLDPTLVEAHVGLAETLARAARLDEAIEAMEAALELAPDHGRAHERLAVWQYYNDNDAAAWDHVQSARAADHPVPPQFVRLLAERTPQP